MPRVSEDAWQLLSWWCTSLFLASSSSLLTNPGRQARTILRTPRSESSALLSSDLPSPAEWQVQGALCYSAVTSVGKAPDCTRQ